MTLRIETSDIVRRWLAGDSAKKIAKDLGCCVATVRYRLNTRSMRMGRAKLDALTIERIQAMRAKGICPKSIAHELKVSVKSVVRYSRVQDFSAVLTELRDQLVRYRDSGKLADTSKVDKQIEALNAVLS